MTIKLAEGVNLHVIPTTKYKTVRIFLRFNTLLDKEKITKRALLSSLLETNSLNYPDQTKISEKLASLYGASFGINVSKKGNFHWLNVSMNLVNEKYLHNAHVLKEAVHFIEEILFHPNIKEGQFDHDTFVREKENLAAYLQSIKEDKQTYASLSLQSLYFRQAENQRIPSFGLEEDVASLTPEIVADYYTKMMAEDQIEIFVLGDVTEQAVVEAFQPLPFMDRPAGVGDIFYQQPVTNVIEERSEREALAQSKLNLGYHTGIYYGSTHYFALQVFNGIFGGFPHSKLFMNVREKENLAYYASSSIDTFRGFLSVQTGIDGKNRNKVLHLIAKELDTISQGRISDLELAQTKAMLKNQYYLSLDNAAAIIEQDYLNQVLTKQITLEDWLKKIEAVTVEDIQKVAKQIKLQAIFFLEGDAAHA